MEGVGLYLIVAICLIVYLFRKKRLLENEVAVLRDKSYQFNDKESKLREQVKQLEWKIAKYDELLKSTTPFSLSASLISDFEELEMDREIECLRDIKSIWASMTVENVKKKYRVLKQETTELKYKYEYVIGIFPELKKYFEDEEALLSLGEIQNVSLLQDEYDHTRDYLSSEEYNALSEDERNQLALDRYKERRRANSRIAGAEYEMYISHCLRNKGYKVVEFGIEKGLEDLGRDIIATKDEFTYIIQCKRYGKHIEVHENVICQLYGTTLHYMITQAQEDLFAAEYIIPVLCTTGILTDIAKEFSRKLGVKVCVIPMGDYPMIKCNINNGNKIYHLPFDQQYWKVKIEKPGEFYAVTVGEATSKGFRRAYRYNFNSD